MDNDISDKESRRLIHFPIVHTEMDLGAMAESANQVSLRRSGLAGVRKKRALIDSIWTEIEHFFERMTLSYPHVNLYQDGLPVCGMEVNIVSDLARNGNRNHQLLLRLMDKGARLMGTESPELLVQEHAMMQKVLAEAKATSGTDAPSHSSGSGSSLLIKRDQFIADRINTTLGKGEVGILFLGLLHNIGPHLPSDIHNHYPLNQIRIQTKAG